MTHKDNDLTLRFRHGDPAAMREVVDLYEGSLYNFGLRICGHKQDAEDILQDTFLNAFRNPQSFRGESGLKTWLFRIAANACFKKRRRKKGQPEFELSLEELLPSGEAEARFQIPDPGGDPSRRMLDSELRRILAEGMQSLPPIYRMVFDLRDMEGFSTEETAHIMGISPQAVKSRLHRARLYLRKTISQRYQGEGWHE